MSWLEASSKQKPGASQTKRILRISLFTIVAVYFLSSLVVGPVDPTAVSSLYHWRFGPIFLGRPITISGDSPHYLVLINSLIEDGDFDLRNNYDQAEAGDWDAGTRFRGKSLDRHIEQDSKGRQLLYHPPFISIILSLFSWPFRGTEWVESVSIWVTMSVTLASVLLLTRIDPDEYCLPLLLAFCTSLWCYGRDIWTEPWLAFFWVGLISFSSLPALALLAFLGTLVKYSFVLVPFTLGGHFLLKKDLRKGAVLIGASGLAIVIAIGCIQLIFKESSHFSLFHVTSHHFGEGAVPLEDFGQISWKSFFGLLFGPTEGLLLFFPFLGWGFWELRRGGPLYLPALVFFLFHGTYVGWHGGAGFATRYLVPMLPVLALAAMRSGRRSYLFWVLVGYSTILASIGGILPVAVYDRSPFEIFNFLWRELSWWLDASFPSE